MSDQWVTRKEASDALGGYIESHPSYGTVAIHHVSGRGHLFGSEVEHLHFLQLSIHEAELHVRPPREDVFGRNELIRISLTEAQFARMITSPNQGSGVPCTIERCVGDVGEPWLNSFGGRPDPPRPAPYDERYKGSMGDRAEFIAKSLHEAKGLVDSLMNGTERLNKGNVEKVQKSLYMALMNFEKNIPYVMNELAEGIENRMSTAKAEFESYVSSRLQIMGLERFADEAPRLPETEVKTLPANTETEP